jgi:hypothetical protein
MVLFIAYFYLHYRKENQKDNFIVCFQEKIRGGPGRGRPV